jgi:hypothetical protein
MEEVQSYDAASSRSCPIGQVMSSDASVFPVQAPLTTQQLSKSYWTMVFASSGGFVELGVFSCEFGFAARVGRSASVAQGKSGPAVFPAQVVWQHVASLQVPPLQMVVSDAEISEPTPQLWSAPTSLLEQKTSQQVASSAPVVEPAAAVFVPIVQVQSSAASALPEHVLLAQQMFSV